MSTLYLIRHGQASFGRENYDDLSEKGHLQARLLAEYFQERGVWFDTIYIGPQQRHQQTAQQTIDLYQANGTGEVEIKELAELAEYDFGDVLRTLIPVMATENKAVNDDVARMFTDSAAFQRIFEAAALRWVSGDYPEGALRPWSEFTDRVNRGLDTIMSRDGKGKTVGVFTSGGPMAVAVQRALKLSDEMTMRLNWQVINCSVTRFKCTTDSLMMTSFNEYPWLEQAGGDGLVTYR